jgi:hypothetical protein
MLKNFSTGDDASQLTSGLDHLGYELLLSGKWSCTKIRVSREGWHVGQTVTASRICWPEGYSTVLLFFI